MRYNYIVLLAIMLLSGEAFADVSVNGGWSSFGDGQGSSTGISHVAGCGGGDPSITMGITSASSVFGAGKFSDAKAGNQQIDIEIGGLKFSVGYGGSVGSEVELTSPGSAMSSSFIGATATGLPTGNGSYDIFGSADLSTEGYLSGMGIAKASAKGSSYYGVAKVGSPSEVWGEVDGESVMNLHGMSSDAYASTCGSKNGLHTNSRTTLSIAGVESAISTSRITNYASVVNSARGNVSSSGTAQSGAWTQSSSDPKVKLSNEAAASSSVGDIRGYVESNGLKDAASISGVLISEASLTGSDLEVSGGPATYSSNAQTSSAERTYSEVWINDSSWGSVTRLEPSITAVQWGNLSNIGSGTITQEEGSYATSFGNVKMSTDYRSEGGSIKSTGRMVLDTYSEASANKRAIAGSMISPTGDGNMWTGDGVMKNEAGFVGGLFHYSFVDASIPSVRTTNIVGQAWVRSPGGNESIIQPFFVSTERDPNMAWSRTQGDYDRSR